MSQVTFVAPTQDGNAPVETPVTQPTVTERVTEEIGTPTVAVADVPQQAGEREALIEVINAKFASDPQYKDFMKIIEAMRTASAPMGLTSINEFNLEQLHNLKQLINA